jgi:hypothetical protein
MSKHVVKCPECGAEISIAEVVTNQVEEMRASIEDEYSREYRDKDLQHQKKISELEHQLGDMKRRLRQPPIQLQGEVAELELEQLLANAFPYDEVRAVWKGVNGADIHHRVRSGSGGACGTIVWEVKTAKDFKKLWISKVKNDQRRESGEIAVIVTKVMPPGLRAARFGPIDGVWVTEPALAIGLASALREGMIGVAMVRRSGESKAGNAEQLYDYMMSTNFKHRVEAIVEAFVRMQGDLEKEQRAMQRQWASRKGQLEQVLHNLAGMWGDIHARAPALPKISRLELEGATDSDGE